MLKIVAVILFLVVSCTAMSQGTWEKVNLPTDQFLRTVFFTDSLYGWIAGDSGTMLHTTSGGITWEIQNSQTTNEITDVFFLNRNLGWASSFNYATPPYGSVMLKTYNGGTTWIPTVYPQEDIFITCINYLDSLNGWMGGKPHAIVKTTDGGVTWTQATVDTSILAFFPVLTIQFYNEQYGYASGGMFDIAGVIWHTSDGGDTWFAMDASDAPADEVHGIHMFDSITVMGAGGDPDFGYGVGMIRTFDGGFNWEYDELTIQGNAYDLDFRNDTEAWAPLGPRQKLIYSLDGGTTWSAIMAPDSSAIYDMTFPDSMHGHAVGRDGAYLKYHPPVIPATGPGPILSSQGWQLHQNSPNPVKDHTTFGFRVPGHFGQNQNTDLHKYPGIKICIFNNLGCLVYQTQEQFPEAGDQQQTADLSHLVNGIYFYRLYLDGIHVTEAGTGKLVVAR